MNNLAKTALFCFTLFLVFPSALAELSVTSENRWISRRVVTEKPFNLDLDVDTIVINTIEKSLQIDGRFWVDDSNTSVPAGDKFLGFTFGAELSDGDIWYRDYGSDDPLVHLDSSDFSYIQNKCFSFQCYDDIYYTVFPNVPANTDKEFRLKFYFAERPKRFLTYFGTGSTGIEVIDGVSILMNTSFMSVGIGNARAQGGSGHISDLYFQGNGTANFAQERIGIQVNATGQFYKTTGTCRVVEGGSVRARIHCFDDGMIKRIFVWKDTLRVYTESETNGVGNFSMTHGENFVASSTSGAIATVADGTFDGNSGVAGNQDLVEGWRMFSAGEYAIAYLYNINETTGKDFITNPTANAVQDFFGTIDGAGHFITAGSIYKERILIGNTTFPIDPEFVRRFYNTSFAENVTYTINQGTFDIISRDAWTVELNGSHTNTIVSLTIDPLYTNASSPHTQKIGYVHHNLSGVNEIRIFNITGSTEPTNANLWHCYEYDGVTDNRWEYCDVDPIHSSGDSLLLGNETQFCTSTNNCSNSMSTADDEYYFVTQFDFRDLFTVIVNDGALPITPAPLIVDFDYCQLLWAETNAEKVSNDNWCQDNITLARNITVRLTVDGNVSLITTLRTEECQYTCDNVTKQCAPNPFKLNMWIAAAILVTVLLLAVIGRFLR